MREKVERALETIRPALQADGGDGELVDGIDGFVKASMIYLGIGAITGLCMVLWPDIRFTVTRVHTHINLLGFMAMMIYGVGYHILPRFMGRHIYSHRLGNIQVWLSNTTLIGLSVSWILEAKVGGIWHYLAILF